MSYLLLSVSLFNAKSAPHWHIHSNVFVFKKQHLLRMSLQRPVDVFPIVFGEWMMELKYFPFYAFCCKQTQCIIYELDLALWHRLPAVRMCECMCARVYVYVCECVCVRACTCFCYILGRPFLAQTPNLWQSLGTKNRRDLAKRLFWLAMVRIGKWMGVVGDRN